MYLVVYDDVYVYCFLVYLNEHSVYLLKIVAYASGTGICNLFHRRWQEGSCCLAAWCDFLERELPKTSNFGATEHCVSLFVSIPYN